MSLLAKNTTGSPISITITGGVVIATLPVSSEWINVTGEFNNRTGSDYALIDAYRLSGNVLFQWDGPVAYSTPGFSPSIQIANSSGFVGVVTTAYTTAGTYSWTSPVTDVVRAFIRPGAGGGAAGGKGGSGFSGASGSGGKGGGAGGSGGNTTGYWTSFYATKGLAYTLVVGAGGTGGTNNASTVSATQGLLSSISQGATTLVLAALTFNNGASQTGAQFSSNGGNGADGGAAGTTTSGGVGTGSAGGWGDRAIAGGGASNGGNGGGPGVAGASAAAGVTYTMATLLCSSPTGILNNPVPGSTGGASEATHGGGGGGGSGTRQGGGDEISLFGEPAATVQTPGVGGTGSAGSAGVALAGGDGANGIDGLAGRGGGGGAGGGGGGSGATGGAGGYGGSGGKGSDGIIALVYSVTS